MVLAQHGLEESQKLIAEDAVGFGEGPQFGEPRAELVLVKVRILLTVVVVLSH